MAGFGGEGEPGGLLDQPNPYGILSQGGANALMSVPGGGPTVYNPSDVAAVYQSTLNGAPPAAWQDEYARMPGGMAGQPAPAWSADNPTVGLNPIAANIFGGLYNAGDTQGVGATRNYADALSRAYAEAAMTGLNPIGARGTTMRDDLTQGLLNSGAMNYARANDISFVPPSGGGMPDMGGGGQPGSPSGFMVGGRDPFRGNGRDNSLLWHQLSGAPQRIQDMLVGSLWGGGSPSYPYLPGPGTIEYGPLYHGPEPIVPISSQGIHHDAWGRLLPTYGTDLT